jgi:hypothetical protein
MLPLHAPHQLNARHREPRPIGLVGLSASGDGKQRELGRRSVSTMAKNLRDPLQ